MDSLSDDAELVLAAKSGDKHAFAELVGRYRRRIWAICYRTTGDREEAEDALQETLVAAWRGLDKFRGDAKFSTWVYRIASNAALAQVRKRKPADDLDDFDAPAATDVEWEVTTSDRIRDALASLNEQYRSTFILRVYGDLSYAEIAEQQGIPVQTVRSRLNRAKHALALELADFA